MQQESRPVVVVIALVGMLLLMAALVSRAKGEDSPAVALAKQVQRSPAVELAHSLTDPFQRGDCKCMSDPFGCHCTTPGDGCGDRNCPVYIADACDECRVQADDGTWHKVSAWKGTPYYETARRRATRPAMESGYRSWRISGDWATPAGCSTGR